MSDMALLRIGILVAGVVLFARDHLLRPSAGNPQGRRVDAPQSATARASSPALAGEPGSGQLAAATTAATAVPRPNWACPRASAGADLGKRANQDFDKIVSLYVAARAGTQLRGQDIVVAAEKTGLMFGHMDVFHRLVEGHPERGPIFSVANIMKPGSFDMANIRELETPAIAFFLTLPAPLSALDAWETMLPTAQRMAELLDGVVLDDSATRSAASASRTSATNCALTTASTRRRR